MKEMINDVERSSKAFANVLMGKATDEDKAIIEAQKKRNQELRDKAKQNK